jgi:hypothetical protein
MMTAWHSPDAAHRGYGGRMSTDLTYEQSFAADPATVMAMLRDPEYVREKGERTGAHDITVEVTDTADGGVVITSSRSMPAEVPAYAAAFVGDTITVTEVQTWTPPSNDGSTTAIVTVAFNSPIAYRGTITLAGGPTGSVARNSGRFKASVPFVGGKVERVAAEQTQRYLAKEVTVGAEWLSRPPR